jgi:hypothetical protein
MRGVGARSAIDRATMETARCPAGAEPSSQTSF